VRRKLDLPLENGETRMEKKFKSSSLLILVLLATLTSIAMFLPSPVHATWIEGEIIQDTVWTLIDSPYIVIGDIIVHSQAMLTIEPGVEILFGGKFSLTVKGKLVAKGTQKHPIKFSSNKNEPVPGDWTGIIFEKSRPSTLEYCLIQYAVNGTTVINGNLKIRSSKIQDCSRNGVAASNSTLILESTQIIKNLENGAYISGVGQVEVTNSSFQENENGILLTGEQVANVIITGNNITLSTQKGVQLNADNYTNVILHHNVISSNNYGFYISGGASINYIVNNSISYNNFGFYYRDIQENHTVRFNDIYNNKMGMDISLSENITNVYVNAEYNYWGARSGPYHESLNPEGKGNPVGGDGTNLDFIPFLTTNIKYLNQRPRAVLLADKNLVAPNQTVMFIATLSHDDGRVDKYYYDFGDGQNSGWTALSVVLHNYSSTGEYSAKLMVMDDFGVKSKNHSLTITVQNLTSLEVSLRPEKYSVDYGESFSLAVRVTADADVPVENANVTLYVIGEIFLSESGLTNASGYFTGVFTAPEVILTTDLIIVATASKSGYADGSDYQYITVVPPLVVEVYADSSVVKSEGTTNINIQVTHDGAPVPDVIVSAKTSNGSFVTQSETTDPTGKCVFIFNAPSTVTPMEVAMNFTAIKEGYLTGHAQLILEVEPKILFVDITTDSQTVMSEETINLWVIVTYDGNPVENATVEISSLAGGNFSKDIPLTDSDGYSAVLFTAPLMKDVINLTIIASASKVGYAKGEGTLMITGKPGVLDMEIEITPTVISPEATATVVVTVKRNGTDIPVSNVEVSITSDSGGVFSPIVKITSENGTATFTFTAPFTSVELNVTLTAVASKDGYSSDEESSWLVVSPEVATGPAFWLSWEFILVITVIVAAVIFFVLVKLKIIVISWKEEVV
jgi:hypothetical protein